MDPFIEAIVNFNKFLEQFYIFRTFRFAIGFYMIIMLITLAGIGYRVGRLYYTVLSTGQSMPHLPKGKLQRRWDKIVERLDREDEAEWKIAVIEAAQMLQENLSTIGYAGDTLGSKLEGMLPPQLENLEEAKEANKIKNKIVNDPSFKITKEEAEKTVEIFGNSMNFFELID